MVLKKFFFGLLVLIWAVNLYSFSTNIIVTGDKNGVIRYYEIMTSGDIGSGVFIDDIGDNVWGVGCNDFNQNGLPDVVTGTPGEIINTGRIFLYINQGTNQYGRFTFNRITLASNMNFNEYVLDFAAADFNLDGYPDFVCSGNTTIPLVFINNQNNSFTMKSLSQTTYYLRGKDVGDFDEDGDIDIVVGEYSSGNLYMYVNNGTGDFIQKNHIGTVPSCMSPYTVTAGDFDKDGHMDIIAGGDVYGETYFFRGDGKGNFQIPEDCQTPLVDGSPYGTPFDMDTYSAAESFDFDKDSHLDLVIVNNDKSQILVALGKGNGLFKEPEKKQFTGDSLSLSVYPKKYNPRSQFPEVKLYNPSFQYQWIPNQIQIIGTVNDSDLDKYVIAYGEGVNPVLWHEIVSNNVIVESNILGVWDVENLNGIYTLRLTAKDNNGNISGAETIVNINNKISVSTQNYVITANDEGELYYFIDQENGTFGVKTYLGDIGRYSRGVAIDDVDNDGDYDFITGATHEDSSYADIYLFINNGENNFTKIIIDKNIGLNSYLMDVTIVDFNNDTYKDIIVSPHDTFFYIYFNNGDGTFSRTTYNPGNSWKWYVRKTSIGDINKDGKIDIIMNSAYLHNISYSPIKMINYVNNQFVYNDLFNVNRGGIYSLLVSDFDNDGNEDILAGGTSDGNMFLYKGNGNGDFNLDEESPFDLNNYTGAHEYDFNKDGNTDIIAVDYTGGDLYFIEGNGDGTFESPELIGNDLGNVLGVASVQQPITHYESRPLAVVSSPLPDSEVKDIININGTVHDEKLLYYKLEYAKTNNTDIWYKIAIASNNILQGKLGEFDTTSVSNGGYFLRLIAVNSNYKSMTNTITITIKNRMVTPIKYYDNFYIIGNNLGHIYFFGINKTNYTIEPQVFQINLDGSKGEQTYYEDIGGGCYGVGIADFNNDGLYDFVAGAGQNELGENYGAVYIFKNKGPYTNHNLEVLMRFEKKCIVSNLSSDGIIYDFAVGDFNDDDYYDFITSCHNNKLYFFKNKGNFQFTTNRIPIPDSMILYGKDAGDYNEDGNLDFIAMDSYRNAYMFKGDGKGQFSRTHLFQINEPENVSLYADYNITTGDYDNDGHLDIIRNQLYGSGYQNYTYSFFYKGNGKGDFYQTYNDKTPPYKKFAYGEPARVWNGYSSLDTYDFNKDGNLDLFGVFYYRYWYRWYVAWFVSKGDGNGIFSTQFTGSLPTTHSFGLSAPPKLMNSRSHYPVVELEDQFKKIDYIPVQGIFPIKGTVTDPDNNLSYYKIMIGKGKYPAEWETIYSNTNPVQNSIIYEWDTSPYNGIYTLKLIALDSDNNLSGDKFQININNPVENVTNYILVSRDDGYLYYFKDNQNGSISGGISLGDFGGGICCSGMADFDMDRDTDFVMANFEGELYLFINDNTGHFVYFKIDDVPEISSDSINIATGDFNQDNLADFILSVQNKLYLYLNNGYCGFNKKLITSINGISGAKETGDFNYDGKNDFITFITPDNINEPNKIILFAGDGNGDFEQYPLFNIDYYVTSLVTGDFNADSFLDIVIACDDPAKLYFIPGGENLSYSFTNNHQPFYTFDTYAGIDSYDFNQDGNLDLCAVKYNNGYMYFFKGLSDGTFQSPAYISSSGGYSLRISTSPVEKKFQPKITAEIFSPELLESITGIVEINGSVSCSDFLKYELNYGKGKSPTIWNNIVAVSNSIISNTLTEWNTETLNGVYTIRLCVFDNQGNVNTKVVPINIVNPVNYPDKNYLLTSSQNGEINFFQISDNSEIGNKRLIDVINNNANGIATADMDNDGDYDFITGDESGSIYAFINGNTNEFTKIVLTNNLSFGPAFNDIKFLNLNNDEFIDFAAAGESSNIYFFTNAQNLKFGMYNQITLEPDNLIRRFVFQDFNEDNLRDLLVLAVTPQELSVYQLAGNTGKWFDAPVKILSFNKLNMDNPYTLAISDFDEDGHYDFIIGGGDNGETFLYAGDGKGNFKIKQDKTTPVDEKYGAYGEPFNFNCPSSTCIFDLNGDLHFDLFVVNSIQEELNYIKAGGNGTFKESLLLDYVGDALGIAVPYVESSYKSNFPFVQITSPTNNSVNKDIIQIDGTINDSDLKYYQLFYGEGENPVEWTSIASGSNILNNSKIYKWNTTDLNGIYSLKLTAVDNENNLNADEIKIFLKNKSKGNRKFLATVTDNGRLFISEIFSNRNIGVFRQIDDVGNYCRGITQIDIDKDGDDDIIVGRGTGTYSGYIYIYLNNGKNIFNRMEFTISYQINSYIMDITVGDFNNNGLNDIIFCGNNFNLYALENKGNYNFQIKNLNVTVPYYFRRIEKGYFNHDDNLDLITSFSYYNKIGICLGDGNFGFSQIITNVMTDNDNYTLLVDDFNRDNHLDFIVGGGYYGRSYIYKNDGNGKFELFKGYNIDNTINKKPDGYIWNLGGNNNHFAIDSYTFYPNDPELIVQKYYPYSYVYIFTNTLPGYFNNNVNYKYYLSNYTLCISAPPKEYIQPSLYPTAKINSPFLKYQPVKGTFSIIGTADASSFKYYKLEYGKGRNPLQWQTISSNINSVKNSQLALFDTTELNGVYTIRLKVHDSNKLYSVDEIPVNIINPVENTNQIIAAGNQNEIYTFIIEGEELLNKKMAGFYINGACGGFGVADFDQDGDLDFVTGAGVNYLNTMGFISIYIQHNDYSFTQIDIDVPKDFIFNSHIMDITVLDYNNDFYPDFIISGNSSTPYLFINNQNNTFTVIQLHSADNNLRAKATGDFNEDGFIDIAMADAGNKVYIYENDKKGGFIKLVPFEVMGNDNYGLTAGDFNEDGHIDLIVCGNDGKLWLYKGDGYNNFSLIEKEQFPTETPEHIKPVLEMGGYYCSLDKIDINKDGHLDLIIQKHNGQIYFAYGTGQGTFESPVYKNTSINGSYAISVPFKTVNPDDIPVAEITYPLKGKMNTFLIDWIKGVAYTKESDDFKEYKLEYGYGEHPEEWHLIIELSTPSMNRLGYWDATGLNGVYTIRLTVQSKKGYTSYDKVNVIVTSHKEDNDKLVALGLENGEVYYMIDNGDGSFEDKVLLDKLDSLVFGVAISDVDHDQDLDILAVEKKGNVYVYLNNGYQDFIKKLIVKDLSIYSDAMDIWTGSFRPAVNYKDLLTSQNNNIPLIFKNDRSMQIWQKNLLPTADVLSRIRKKTVQDFNYNGTNDFISLDYEGNIYLYLNQTKPFQNLQFTNFKLLSITNTFLPYTFISGDFDEDGIYDLIVGGAEDGDAYFYKGTITNGFMNFTFQTNFTVFDFNEETASYTFDFNQDGFLDIIAVTYKSNKLWYIPGKQGREFDEPVLIDNNVPLALGISALDDLASFLNTPPQAVINQPTRDDNVNGFIHISGVAYDSDFKEYFLEYGYGYNPTNWILINYSTNAVTGGELGVWDSNSNHSGIYSLRLRVTDMSNQTSSDFINVNLVPSRAYIFLNPESPLREGIVSVVLSNDKPLAFIPELYFKLTPNEEKHYVSLFAVSTNNDLWTGTYEITTNTGDGRARFHYKGEDDFGNIGTEILQGEYFQIDTGRPYTEILFSTSPPLNAGYYNITIIASESLAEIPELYFIPYNCTNKIWIQNIYPSGINQYSGVLPVTANLSNGEAKFYFKGIDLTGNIGTEIITNETFFIGIDRINPIAQIISPVSNEVSGGIVLITGTAVDMDYFGTGNNFGYYRLEYGEGENPVEWCLIQNFAVSVYSNLLAEWDTSDLSGYYTIRLTVVDGTGNSAEDKVFIRLNNVHHFKIIHDGEGFMGIPEPVIVSVRDRNGNIIPDFTGVVTIDTVEGNEDTISWENISGQGNFIDEGAGSDKCFYEFVGLDSGVITLAIIDNTSEYLDLRVKNAQAEDDDTEGLLFIQPLGIVLIYPENNSIISDITPTFKWEIPEEDNNKLLHFKLEIAEEENFNSIIYTFDSKEISAGFTPLPPVYPGRGFQYYTMLKSLEYNKMYYWRVFAWNGLEYYIDSFIWKFEIRK